MKLLHIILALMLVHTASSQTINLEHFNKRVFTSDFNSAKDAKLWPAINNQEELIILNNEEFTLERKNFNKELIIFPNWHSTYPSFELDVSVNLQHLADKNQSAGICFAYSREHETGFILELNKQKKYRIKQIGAEGLISFISGTSESNSWKKSNMLYPKQEFNQINILVLENTVDIYLNNFFVFSFSHKIEYHYRDFGLYVGKGSKAIFHHVYLLINHTDYGKYDQNIDEVDLSQKVIVEEHVIKKEVEHVADDKKQEEVHEIKEDVTEIVNEDDSNETEIKTETLKTEEETEVKNEDILEDPDVKKCLEMIVDIRNDLSATQKELETYISLLEDCKDDNARMNEFITMNMDDRLKNKAASLELENERLKDEIQKLKSENATLQDFKTFYQDANKDEDIVNFLYDELKKIEEKNAYLARQVEILENKLK